MSKCNIQELMIHSFDLWKNNILRDFYLRITQELLKNLSLNNYLRITFRKILFSQEAISSLVYVNYAELCELFLRNFFFLKFFSSFYHSFHSRRLFRYYTIHVLYVEYIFMWIIPNCVNCWVSIDSELSWEISSFWNSFVPFIIAFALGFRYCTIHIFASYNTKIYI